MLIARISAHPGRHAGNLQRRMKRTVAASAKVNAKQGT
jgi:hypothetical protein